jgi:hypothetical protein
VRTFRSARHSRPEGLHYSDFFTGFKGGHYGKLRADRATVVKNGIARQGFAAEATPRTGTCQSPKTAENAKKTTVRSLDSHNLTTQE